MCDVNLERLHRVEGKGTSEAVCCVRGVQSPMEGAAPVQGGTLSTKTIVIMLQNKPIMVKSPYLYKL